MVEECLEWIKHCYSGKDWPTSLIIIGSASMFLILVFSIANMSLFLTQYRKKGESEQQCWINLMITILAIVRIPWWWMNLVTYADNTPPAIWI